MITPMWRLGYLEAVCNAKFENAIRFGGYLLGLDREYAVFFTRDMIFKLGYLVCQET